MNSYSNMRNSFVEVDLPDNFCKEYAKIAEERICSSKSFTLLSMPASGASLFLKFLTTKPLAHFIYIDTYSLANPTKQELYLLLLKELGGKSAPDSEQEIINEIRKRLDQLSKDQKRIVIIINRFSEMEQEFDKSFFGTLRMFCQVSNNISMIFSITKPYLDISPDAISGGNLHIFTEYIYFRLLPERDLLLLLKLHSSDLISDPAYLNEAIVISGGHLQLLQLLLKSERKNNPLLDPYIKILLQEIYGNLNYKQKKEIGKIAFGKPVEEIDEYLLQIGYVNKKNGIYSLFSTLFTQYIKSSTKLGLPVKEARLFALLKKNLGQTVSKDEIFKSVWKDEVNFASDWALDSLIYRIRKNAAFQATGYIIENHKKLGYTLVKN